MNAPSDNHISDTDPRLHGTSKLLCGVLAQLQAETVSVGELLDKLEQRSFGGIIVLLSLLGLIPGISVLAGLAILVLSLQMIKGNQTARLPRMVTARRLDVAKLRKVMRDPIKYIASLEKLVKPRFPMLLQPLPIRLTGGLILCLALVMISPLPLSNILPAIALLQLSLGLLESDGVAMITGWISAAIAIIVGVVMILAAAELTALLFSR